MAKFTLYIISIKLLLYTNLFSQSNYFPIHIGDYHNYFSNYNRPWAILNNFVFDTINMDGNKYFLITDSVLDTVRIDKNKNVYYRKFNKDWIRYKINAKIGETWVDESSPSKYTYNLISRNDSVITASGIFRNCLKFCFDSILKRYDWLAPGIGLIKGTGYYDIYNYNINNNFKPSELLANERRNINANIDTNDYFPMKVGNYYCYYEGVYQKIMYFMDTINLEGKKYHLLLDGYIDTVRIDDDGNVFYRTRRMETSYIHKDQLFFKLNGNVGDVWFSDYYDGLTRFGIDSKTDRIETPIGIFNNCLMIRTTAERAFWFAPEFGIIRDASDRGDKRLYNARINGIRYPGPVSVNQKIEIPASYKLFQNYPNPFNPGTVISYQLSASSFVVLNIYDILGREVKTLENERKPAGKYQIVFDSKNISSGVYIYSLKIKPDNNGKEILFRKTMTIVK